jgi:hypothetical protein
MKGVSFALIGGVVLALVGVTVMVALFTDMSPVGSGSGFCGVYRGLSPSLPDAITPSVTGCQKSPSVDYRPIDVDDASGLKVKLAAAVAECWKEFNGYDVDFKHCKAWNIGDFTGEVRESSLNAKMKSLRICPEQIENNIIDNSGSASGSVETCGSKNQIKFRPEKIEGPELVIIGYNASRSQPFVEVK